jgi:hypothetical protein
MRRPGVETRMITRRTAPLLPIRALFSCPKSVYGGLGEARFGVAGVRVCRFSTLVQSVAILPWKAAATAPNPNYTEPAMSKHPHTQAAPEKSITGHVQHGCLLAGIDFKGGINFIFDFGEIEPGLTYGPIVPALKAEELGFLDRLSPGDREIAEVWIRRERQRVIRNEAAQSRSAKRYQRRPCGREAGDEIL